MSKYIGREIGYVAHRIKRSLDQRVNEFQITSLQSKIIHYISNSETDVFQKDLEEAFHIRRSSVTSVLQTMEKNDLISRISSSKDGRVKIITLTTKAKHISEELCNNFDAFEEYLISDLSDQEIENFNKTLAKILEKLDD